MIRATFRLLMLFACGLTVLPPGWCCAAAKALAPAPKPEEPAPCRSCCCCPPEPGPRPEAPPTPPARSWCCERVPADAPRTTHLDSPDVPSFDQLPLPAVPALRTRVALAVAFVPDDPLHLLHCVWRC